MQRRQGEEARPPAPGSGLPSWEAMWQQAYRLLQAGPARGWQPADWEDMAQEVVLRVITVQTAGKAVDERTFAAWFRTVVANVVRDRWRQHHGRKGTRETVPWQEDLAGTDEGRAAELRQTQARHDVQALLERTPSLRPEERTVLELTYWYDLSLREIAHVLGGDVSHNEVYTWLQAALRKLRERSREA